MAIDQDATKDLKMINPEPSPSDSAFEAMFDSAKRTGSSRPVPTSAAAQQKAIKGMQADIFFDQSVQEGSRDQKLDKYASSFEDKNATRARNQNEAIKGIKAIGGGLIQGGLIVGEQLGYVADLKNTAKMFSDAEDMSGNWWSNMFRDAQDSLRESDTFKIYESGTDENSILSQIFKWSSLEGAISSAVGFGVSGLGAASVVSKLGALKQFGKLAAMTDKVMGNVAARGLTGVKAAKAMQGAVGSTRAFTGPLASSAMSNFYMGQLMATDTYTQSMDAIRGKIDSGEISELDAQKIANENAKNVVGLNMALATTSFLRFGSIFKRGGRLKGLVKDPTAMAQLKDMVIKGSPTAFGENVYQEMIQMEQIYKTSLEAGVASKYGSGYWDRMTQLALSNRAMHAGALGVVGGPIQFAIIQKPLMREQHKQQKETFDNQQASRKYHATMVENLVKGDMTAFMEFDKARNEAIIAGDFEAAALAEDMGLIREVVKSNEWGTIDYLRRDIENELKHKETPEGYDANYKENGQRALEMLDKVESYNYAYSQFETKSDLIYTNLAIDALNSKRVENNQKLVASAQQVQAMAVLEGVEVNFDTDTGRFTKVKRDKNRFEGLSTKEAVAQRNLEKTQDKAYDKFMEKAEDITGYKDAIKSDVKYTNLGQKLLDKYSYLKSDKAQEKALKMKKDQYDNAKENIKKADAEDKAAATEKKNSGLTPFSVVKARANKETAEEKAVRTKAWDAEVQGVNTPREGNTFTSRDQQGVSRLYSKGDMLRSNDGRYFKVDTQAGAAKNANLASYAMPLVYEVTAEGKKPGGKEDRWIRFIPEDNTFFRPEVKQAHYNSKTKSWYHKGNTPFAPYVDVDSAFKPNNELAQEARRQKAADGIALSVNNFELEANQPGEGQQIVETEMAAEYDLKSLNNPLFPGESYEVTFKLNKQPNGQTFVDVYRGDSKLTRLDRHSNLNHQVIAQALLKGEVAGSVIGHYSSSNNLVKLRNEDGTFVQSSIAELSKMDSKYLVNGKVHFAINPGEYAQKEPVTMAEDGTIITDNRIEHTDADGVKHSLSIPYSSMKSPGDTYMLIIGPGGHIIPIATRGKKLAELDSMSGEGTRADDIVKEVAQVTEEFITEDMLEGMSESEFDTNLRATIAVSNKSSHEQAQEFRNQKIAKLDEHWRDFSKKMEETIYQTIKKDGRKWNSIGTTQSGENIYQATESGTRIVNPNMFKIGLYVDENGKFTPQIQEGTGTTKVNYTNLSESATEFTLALGDRFDKISYDRFLDSGDAATNKTNAEYILNESGLSTDLNIRRPFAGSSATIKVDGMDIAVEGAAVADKHFTKHDRGSIEAITKPADEAFKKSTIEELDTFTSFESTDADSIGQLMGEEAGDAISHVLAFLGDLGLANMPKVNKEFKDFINKEVEVTEYQDSLKYAEAAGFKGENAVMAAKVHSFLTNLTVDIKNNKQALFTKANQSMSEKEIQLENHTFKRGAQVYSKKHGKGTITKTVKNGYYFMKNYKGDTKKVWAADVVTLDSKYTELFKAQRKLAKMDPADTGYKTTKATVTRLEAKYLKHSAVPSNETVNDGPKVTATPAVSTKKWTTGSTSLTITDAHDRVATVMATYGGISAKGNELAAQKKANGEKLGLTRDEATNFHKLLEDNIIFTEAELLDLKRKAADLGAKHGNEVLANQSENFIALNEIYKNIKANTDMTKAYPTLQVAKVNKRGVTTKLNYAPISMLNTGLPEMGSTKSITSPFSAGELGGSFKAVTTAMQNVLKTMEAMEALEATDGVVTPAEVAPSVETKTAPAEAPGKKITIETTPKADSVADVFKSKGLSPALAEQVTQLTDNQQFELKQAMDLFEGMEQPLPSTLEEIMEGPKFKSGDAVTLSKADFHAEVVAAKAMLPQVPFKVVENVVAMVNKYGTKAIGAYHQGVVTLVEGARKGTAYHEVFHGVADLQLRPFEKQAIAEEMGYQKWNLELEERLADMFAEYVVNHQDTSIVGKVKRFFQGLLDWFNGTRTPELTRQIFEKTATGGYASSTSLNYLSNIENHVRKFSTMDAFQNSLSQKESVTLRNLMNNKRIKIVC